MADIQNPNTPLNTIKNWFKTSLIPTQLQFWALFDSFWHKSEKIPADKINNLQNLLDEKADEEVVSNHLSDADAHKTLFDNKVDTVAGKGLSTNDFTDDAKQKLDKLPLIEVSSYQQIESGGAGFYILTSASNGYDADSEFTKLSSGKVMYRKTGTKITTAGVSRNITKTEDIVFITANVDLTLTKSLLNNKNLIIKMRDTDDFTANILAGADVTIEPANFQLTKGKMCSIIRYPESDTFIITK